MWLLFINRATIFKSKHVRRKKERERTARCGDKRKVRRKTFNIGFFCEGENHRMDEASSQRTKKKTARLFPFCTKSGLFILGLCVLGYVLINVYVNLMSIHKRTDTDSPPADSESRLYNVDLRISKSSSNCNVQNSGRDDLKYPQSLDGAGNHPKNIGKSFTQMHRYYHPRALLSNSTWPSDEDVYNRLFMRNKPGRLNRSGLSVLTAAWGRFLLGMLVDIHNGTIDVMNGVSSFIDASNIYGSDHSRAAKLRAYKNGFMRTTHGREGPLLMVDPSTGTYICGDSHCADDSLVAAIHVLMLREHNRIAHELKESLAHDTTDEMLYQLARAVVIGKIQAITYNEFLPALIGKESMRAPCYNQNANPAVSVEWASSAALLFYSMANEKLMLRRENTGRPIMEASLDDMTSENPKSGLHTTVGVSSLILGAVMQFSEEIDHSFVEQPSPEHVPCSPDSKDRCRTERNIILEKLRESREHRVPDYVTMRWLFYGYPVRMWSDITTDANTAMALDAVYGPKGWTEMDFVVGALAEDHLPGRPAGYSIVTMFSDQFSRIRDGDAYFYLWNKLSMAYREEIHATTIKKLVLRNTNIDPVLLKEKSLFFVSNTLPDKE